MNQLKRETTLLLLALLVSAAVTLSHADASGLNSESKQNPISNFYGMETNRRDLSYLEKNPLPVPESTRSDSNSVIQTQQIFRNNSAFHRLKKGVSDLASHNDRNFIKGNTGHSRHAKRHHSKIKHHQSERKHRLCSSKFRKRKCSKPKANKYKLFYTLSQPLNEKPHWNVTKITYEMISHFQLPKDAEELHTAIKPKQVPKKIYTANNHQGNHRVKPSRDITVQNNTTLLFRKMRAPPDAGEHSLHDMKSLGHSRFRRKAARIGHQIPEYRDDRQNFTVVLAQVGRSATINCYTKYRGGVLVSWLRRDIGYIITVGHNVFSRSGRYELHHDDDEGLWQLTITNIRSSDEGVYECQLATNDKPVSLFFNLTVKGEYIKVGWREEAEALKLAKRQTD